jgi:hypothetical protein
LSRLSRDSLFDQRIDVSLDVQSGYGGVDDAIERVGVGAIVALLAWIGLLSSTMMTGFNCTPGLGA